MRILVTELPKEPKECLFSMNHLSISEHDKDILPKCSFKVNATVSNFPSWSFAPDKYTCDLCAGKRCPYLMTYTPGVKHERKM